MEGDSGRIPRKVAAPDWFGRRYPTLDDLVQAIEASGALVGWAAIGSGLYVAGEDGDPPVVLAPTDVSHLTQCWMLAHELAHLRAHAGHKTRWTYDRDEVAADRWAARALIPRGRVLAHGNASLDAFIGALSAHYGDIPLIDCPDRRLAARIAATRLKHLEESA